MAEFEFRERKRGTRAWSTWKAPPKQESGTIPMQTVFSLEPASLRIQLKTLILRMPSSPAPKTGEYVALAKSKEAIYKEERALVQSLWKQPARLINQAVKAKRTTRPSHHEKYKAAALHDQFGSTSPGGSNATYAFFAPTHNPM